MLINPSPQRYISRKRTSKSRSLLILAILVSLPVLLACQSLSGRQSEPPLPTIVPVEATETPVPAVSEAEESTPIETAPSPTAMPSPTATSAPVGDTIADRPTDTPTSSAVTATDTLLPPTDTPIPTEPPPTPTSQPAGPPVLPLESVTLNLTPVVSGLDKLTFLTHAGDGSGRLFVVEQRGRILIIKDGAVNPTPFLDIVPLVGSDSLERGLLSVAFHPDYDNNGIFFVNYTDRQGNTVIARYQVSGNPEVADPNSVGILLTIDQPYPNHNGGQLAFGPDGYLYVGMGDGGSANDPQNNGQVLNTLLGKILRLDVDNAAPYGVPENNPFINQSQTRPEIWSFGWRNPWRFSFDTATGDLYIADVGQNQYEEVNIELAGAPGGQNYGWRWLEGLHCFNPPNCDPGSLGTALPIAEYDHQQGCSVTGGYVYRGDRFVALDGIYLYGDFCSGKIWGLRREADGSWSQAELLQSGLSISSFGQDEAGEVYLLNHQGDVFQIGN